MDVSVIVPTRNRSALLALALRSVLRQQRVELEVIVVDEASTDDTPVVIAGLADERIRVLRHDTPVGVAGARNRGAFLARGDWLAFLDDDDLWAPDKLVRQLQAANDMGCDWAYGGAVVIDTHGRILRAQRPLSPSETVKALPRYDAVPGGGSNVVIRRATWHQTGPFDTRLGYTDDWEMYIRLAKHGLPACVCSPLVARRLHGSNSTLDLSEVVRDARLIETLHHTRADWGRLHRWMAHSCLRAGRRRAALGQFAQAAARGQGRGVASDLSDILRRRVFGPPTVGDASLPTGDAWIATATGWLRDLQHGAIDDSRAALADSDVAQTSPRQS